MSPTELAWAAGFFEGEGSVYITMPHPRKCTKPYLRLNVTQLRDRLPLDRFVAAVGFGRVAGPHLGPSGERNRYAIDYSGPRAHAAMELLRPYLGEESKKTKRYLEALALGATPVKADGWKTRRANEARALEGGEQPS